MTKRKAKELVVKVWQYFADHSDKWSKGSLLLTLWEKIKNLYNMCPLCEVFLKPTGSCEGCPLGSCDDGSLYEQWQYATEASVREKAARGIVDTVQAWETEKE